MYFRYNGRDERISLCRYQTGIGSFSQGISNDYIREINKDVNFSKFEQGTSITVDIPFLIHSISFPHSINADKLNKEEWQLYFSVTPGKYVRMGK